MNDHPKQTDAPINPDDKPAVLNYTARPTNPVKPSKIRIIYQIIMLIFASMVVMGFIKFINEILNYHQ